MASNALFQELILQHYRRSRHRGPLPSADAQARVTNPVCGDEITLQLLVDGERIREARFTGQGCSVSQAAASMTAQLLEGATLEEASRLGADFRRVLSGELQPSPDLGDLRALAGISKYPTRIRCALLPWQALDRILQERTTPSV